LEFSIEEIFLHREFNNGDLRPSSGVGRRMNLPRGGILKRRLYEHMQLEVLKIFCDVVRWTSFSRAAEENSISQPTASQAVHQLENRLGVRLIDRSKRPLVLTPHGEVFYEGCKEIIARYAELETRVKALENDANVVGTVRVSSIYSVGLHHMTRYVAQFQKTYPGAKVRLEYLHPTRVLESVLEGDVELGLISYPRKWPELTVIPWREESMVLAVPPSHRLASKQAVPVAELDGETFVTFDQDLSIRRAINRFLRKHDVSVTAALEFDNIENIKRAVEAGAGVAILPEPTLVREVETGALGAVRFLDASLARPLAILHRRGGELGLAAARFLSLLTTKSELTATPEAKPHAATIAESA